MEGKKLLHVLRRTICIIMCFLLVYLNAVNLIAQEQTTENVMEDVGTETEESEEIEETETDKKPEEPEKNEESEEPEEVKESEDSEKTEEPEKVEKVEEVVEPEKAEEVEEADLITESKETEKSEKTEEPEKVEAVEENEVTVTANHFNSQEIININNYDNELEDELNVTRYTVSFDANGGTGDVPPEKQITPNTVIIMPEQGNLTNGDKVFVGWSLINNANDDSKYKPENKGTVYKPGSTDFMMPEEDIVMYATWSEINIDAQFFIRLDGMIPTEPQSYPNAEYMGPIDIENAIKVATFYTNLANGVNDMLNSIPTEEQIKNIYPSYNPEKEFVLWYVIKRQNVSWHVDGVLIQKEKVNLAYNPNAPTGTWSNMPNGSQYYVGDIATVSDEIPVRKDYTFLGWNTQADNSGMFYTGNDTLQINENTTLYAQWKSDLVTSYIVEYYLQMEDGEYAETPNQELEKYAGIGSMVYSETEALTFDGYEYDENNINNIKSGIVNSNSTLVLKRYYYKIQEEKEKVNLTYNPNAPIGTFSNIPKGKQYYVGDTATVSNEVPIRNEYTFVNWNTKADNSGTSYVGNDIFIINENVTLYAQWLPNSVTKYVVEYYLQMEDGKYSEIPNKKVENYAFVGATVYSETQALTFDGYEYDESNVNNIKSGVVNNNGTLVLKRYYYKMCNIRGRKKWDDANNRDNIRPRSIIVYLLKSDTMTIVKTKKVTKKDNWEYSFDNLPGKESDYIIGEEVVSGYKAKFNGFNITNTHKPEGDKNTIGRKKPELNKKGYIEVVVPVTPDSNETKVIQIPFTGDSSAYNILPIIGLIVAIGLFIIIIMLRIKKKN